MSYILDALRKAERERSTKRVPMLMTVHDQQGAQRNRLVVVLGGLTLCAVAAIWFLASRPNETALPQGTSPSGVVQDDPAGAPAMESQSISANAAAPPAESLSAPKSQLPDTSAPPGNGTYTRPAAARQPEARRIPSEPTAESPPAAGSPASRAVGVPPPQQSRTEALNSAAAEVAPPLAETGAGSSPANAAAAAAPSQSQPASLREAVARMKLTLLVYAEAEAERVVYIDGRKYVKGDLVEGHYLIEDITVDGVVLIFGGERSVLRP